MDDYWLLEKAEVQERPFISPNPRFGRFITWLVTQLHMHVTQRYGRPLLIQQNQFNRLLVEALQDQDARLILQDRQQAELIHQIAELTSQLKQMKHRLTQLESASKED
jgi:hypothetical protein